MKKIYTLLLSSLLLLSACDSYLDITPVGGVIPTTAEQYRALLARAYKTVPSDRGMACFRSDEMGVNSNSDFDQNAYRDLERWNDVAPNPGTSQYNWGSYYSVIFLANHVIENQQNITEGSADVINQLVGEAYLLRAYMHFLLVNLHGQPYTKPGALTMKAVPLKLDNDLEAVLKRNTVEEVYASILIDVEEARKWINQKNWELIYSYRFNTLAVDALQSRLALYMGQWQTAYEAAEAVLAQQSALEDLNASAILPNNFKSVEAIVALELPMSSSVNNATRVPASFLSSYQAGDQRLSLYFSAPDKEGVSRSQKGGKSEFSCTFRVGEVYLNSAEAAARLNNLPQARERLLQLMQHRYTPEAYAMKAVAVNGMEQEALITEVLNERARELALEGHRWFDLRRTTRPRMVKVIGGETLVLEQDDPRYTMPIPKDAIAANPGLAN